MCWDKFAFDIPVSFKSSEADISLMQSSFTMCILYGFEKVLHISDCILIISLFISMAAPYVKELISFLTYIYRNTEIMSSAIFHMVYFIFAKARSEEHTFELQSRQYL